MTVTLPRGEREFSPYTVVWAVKSTATDNFQTEVQRTSKGGGSTPATSAWVTLRTLAVGQTYLRDVVAPSTLPSYYRARHVRIGWDAGAWSTYYAAVPSFRDPGEDPDAVSGGLEAFSGDLDSVNDGTNYVKLDTNYADTNRPSKLRAASGAFDADADDFFASSGTIKNSVGIKDTAAAFIPLRHTETGAGYNSTSVSFDKDYETIPSVTFIPQVALAFSNTLGTGADQFMNMQASSLGVSGFELRAELQQGDSVTAFTDGFSASQNTASPETGTTLTLEGSVAYSNLEDANSNETQYTVSYEVDASSMVIGNRVTVEVGKNASATSTSFTTVASNQFLAGSTYNKSVSFTATLGSSYDLRIRITYLNPPGSATASVLCKGQAASPPGVAFDRVDSGGTSVAMASTTGEAVAWIAQEAP